MTEMNELRDADRGVWEITTLASRYEIDLDARTVGRRAGEGPGAGEWPVNALRRDDELLRLIAVARCAIGQPAILHIEVREDVTRTVGVKLTTTETERRPRRHAVDVDPTSMAASDAPMVAQGWGR